MTTSNIPMTSTETTSKSGPGNSELTEEFRKPDIAKLNGYYTDGDSVDQAVFSDMRSNILLYSGEHYNRRQSSFYRRIRDSKELAQEQKLRLTKNHIQKICKMYSNSIVSPNPGVGFSPKDENSMHDQKVAELHHSVWLDAHDRYNIDDKIDDWVDAMVHIGELHVKVFYDPTLGPVKGYEPQIDPLTGQPFLDETGQMVADEGRPLTDGEFVFEDIYGFNLLRPAECKDIRKAEWLCIRKMASKEEFLRKYKNDEAKLKMFTADQDETYVIFDAIRGGYKQTNKQSMIREFFFRPSLLFPEGYYYLTTKNGIVEEGPLPGGFFPIISASFERMQTTPRGISLIKTLRPYQAEINRAASKIAEHQITLGDDKLLIQNGTKISAGIALPGVRSINYTGMDPKVLPGRAGDQYLAYMNSQITEMYNVAMVQEVQEEATAQMDPYILLFRSAKEKKKFQRYIKRFNKFLIEIVQLYLRLAKIHLPDDMVIMAVGKNEQVNIPEFRQQPDTCYEITLEEQSEDVETKLGKQIVINHVLQYVGNKLDPEDIGKLMKQMPYANQDSIFDDFTLNYDSVMNDMLALDRGEKPPVGQYDDHKYAIKKLSNRMSKADFQFLDPQIKENYAAKIQLHQQFVAADLMAIQRAQQGLIPVGGYEVTCDFYVKDPTDASGLKTRRARVPYQAMEWLLQQLESQGASQTQISNMSGGVQTQLANQVLAQGGGQPRGGQLTPAQQAHMPSHPPSMPGMQAPPLAAMGAV